MKRNYVIFTALTLVFFQSICLVSTAQTLRIAVAANAQGVIKKLQSDFKKRTGIESQVIIGASGKLTTQIINGAPYDIFLSADSEFPDKLYNEGFGLEKPKIYALGSLIVCGLRDGNTANWQSLVENDKVRKIAVANPKTAPYGKAALESLKYYKLDEKIKGKLVYGESISQINTYLQTGVVDVGFTTESFLYDNVDKSKLRWSRIDERSYTRIEQGAILLTHSKKSSNATAYRFYKYLFSAPARKIIAANGYHLPK